MTKPGQPEPPKRRVSSLEQVLAVRSAHNIFEAHYDKFVELGLLAAENKQSLLDNLDAAFYTMHFLHEHDGRFRTLTRVIMREIEDAAAS